MSHWTPPVELRSHRHTCRPQQSLPHQTTWRHLVDTHYFSFFPVLTTHLSVVFNPCAVARSRNLPDNKSIYFIFSVRWWPCDAWSWGVTQCCHSFWEEKQCWVLSAEEYCFHTCVVFSCMLLIFENIWPFKVGNMRRTGDADQYFRAGGRALNIGLLGAHCWYPCTTFCHFKGSSFEAVWALRGSTYCICPFNCCCY